MRRRAYLSTLAVVLAGCGGDGDSTPTDQSTPTPSATTTAAPTDTPTATEAGTPTPAQPPDEPLEAFEWWLVRAFEAYVPSGETFTSVDASTTSVDVSAIHDPLDEAQAQMESLADAGLSGERQTRFENLQGTYHFLRRTANIHAALTTAWTAHETAWNSVLTREGSVGAALTDVTNAVDQGRGEFNNLVAESDASDLAAFPPLITADWDRKRTQFRRELDAFDRIVEGFDAYESAMRDADRAMTLYDSGRYDSATVGFNQATAAFESLASTFGEQYPSHFVAATTDDAQCIASAMQAGCARMSSVSQSLANGSGDDPDDAKSTARSRFEQCTLVFDRVKIVQDFYA